MIKTIDWGVISNEEAKVLCLLYRGAKLVWTLTNSWGENWWFITSDKRMERVTLTTELCRTLIRRGWIEKVDEETTFKRFFGLTEAGRRALFSEYNCTED